MAVVIVSHVAFLISFSFPITYSNAGCQASSDQVRCPVQRCCRTVTMAGLLQGFSGSCIVRAGQRDLGLTGLRIALEIHRSHFGSRYKLGCCGHASLFGLGFNS